jgi:hypothetical protein
MPATNTPKQLLQLPEAKRRSKITVDTAVKALDQFETYIRRRVIRREVEQGDTTIDAQC